MPPTTLPTADVTGRIQEEIEGIIDQLEEFGDEFADVIDELRALQDRF